MNIIGRLFFSVLLLSLVLTKSACGGGEGDQQQPSGALASAQVGGSTPIEWLDFNEGLTRAKRDRKPLFLEFYTDWCGYCRMLHRETLANPRVAEMLTRKFVSVRLNAENSRDRVQFMGQDLSHLELAQAFGVRGYPALAFLDTEGKPITMINGFVPADRFFPLLNYISQKCYLAKMSFHDFVKKGRCD